MGKKNKSSQFPKKQPIQKTVEQKLTSSEQTSMDNSFKQPQRIQPEQINLEAYQHIQNCLTTVDKTNFNKEDLNAILRLAQHLRVFGLLSAVGYINQSNQQEGKIRTRTIPIWRSLLGQLLEVESSATNRELMERVINLNKDTPSQYIAAWRKSLIFSNHWNFWAKAYGENTEK